MGSKTRTPADVAKLQEELRLLTQVLWLARDTIVDQSAEAVRPHLKAARRCESLDDLLAWENWAVDGLLQLARSGASKPRTGSPRALCPACGAGSQRSPGEGFVWPAGLERHMRGANNSRTCRVFRAACELAREAAASQSVPEGVRLRAVDSRRPWSAGHEQIAKGAEIISIAAASRARSTKRTRRGP